MSGMDGKISNRDLRWWLKELARPRDAASGIRQTVCKRPP